MTSAVRASTCIPGSGSPASAVDATTRNKNGAAMRPICLLFMMYSFYAARWVAKTEVPSARQRAS